jgi:hypothetical protein
MCRGREGRREREREKREKKVRATVEQAQNTCEQRQGITSFDAQRITAGAARQQQDIEGFKLLQKNK